MIYHIQLNAGTGSQFQFVGVSLDTENHISWLASVAVLAVGLVGLEFARRAFIRVWSRAQEEIEAEIRAREPA
jgi:branched-chain amino acid transport system permease protein